MTHSFAAGEGSGRSRNAMPSGAPGEQTMARIVGRIPVDGARAGPPGGRRSGPVRSAAMTASSQASPRRVFLLGLMGSGKTTVGRELAARTGWPYLDNDDLVRRSTGREPAEIEATDGEDGLH